MSYSKFLFRHSQGWGIESAPERSQFSNAYSPNIHGRIQNCLIVILMVFTVSNTPGTASADIVVNSRHSLGDFDVVGVFPGEFERRDVTDETMSLTGNVCDVRKF